MDVSITKAKIQGHSNDLNSFLQYLKNFFAIEFDGAAIVWNEANIIEEDRLTSVTIEETPVGTTLKRIPSSGEFMEKQFEEISLGGSAATENFKNVIETFNMLTSAASVLGIGTGWIPHTKKEHISIQYKDERFDLQVSTITSLPALVQTVSEKFYHCHQFSIESWYDINCVGNNLPLDQWLIKSHVSDIFS